jgi:hypothetical protein
MAGEIGIGNKTVYEPVILDGSSLPIGSWDIILETGIGTNALVKSEQGLQLLIQSSGA